jgi:hypothetical protein
MGIVIDFKVAAISWFNKSGPEAGGLFKFILTQIGKI